MNRLERCLDRVREVLDDLGVQGALVGGLAVSSRAEPRFTRDVDVAVAVQDDPAAERIVRELIGRGWRLIAQVEQERTGRLATVRFEPPSSEGVVADLLFASSGIESEVVIESETIQVFDEVRFPVARVPHLLALKVLACEERRPQDLADIGALLEVATKADLDSCRTLLDLIEKRGFHRDKELRAELASAIERFGSSAR